MRIGLIVVFMVLYVNGNSQNYLGINYGKNDFNYSQIDTGNGLTKDKGSFKWVISIDYLHKINKSFYLETGLMFNQYYQQISTSLYPAAYNEVYSSLIIPFRLNYTIRLLRDRLGLSFFVGYSQGVKLDRYQSVFSAVSYTSPSLPPDSIVRGNFFCDRNLFYPLVDIGSRLITKVSGRFSISLSGNLSKGFSEIGSMKFYYNNGTGNNDHYAEQYNYGTYFNLGLGVQYDLSKPK